VFEESENKVLVRRVWDFPLLVRYAEKQGHKLSYFGLPGPYIADIIEWQSCLGDCTGVERLRKEKEQREEDLDVHRLIHKNVWLSGLDTFQLLRGDIEDVILRGVDQDMVRPKLSTNHAPFQCCFHYDVVNLDFCGGMGYKDKDRKSRRVQALKKLLERQRGTDFLFLLTLNVRDGIDDELILYLEGAKRAAVDQKQRDILDWYATSRKGMKEYRLKALVPLFIRKEGETWGLDCFCYPPLAYTGSGSARMVHFVFEMTNMNTILHAHSRQRFSKLIGLPLLGIKDKTLQVLPRQHPNFDFHDGTYLASLPDQIQQVLCGDTPKMT